MELTSEEKRPKFLSGRSQSWVMDPVVLVLVFVIKVTNRLNLN